MDASLKLVNRKSIREEPYYFMSTKPDLFLLLKHQHLLTDTVKRLCYSILKGI